jgi:pyroglutamyl-peptidase
MPILLTAFQPFGGRTQNASALALIHLRKIIPNLRTRILPVESVRAPAILKHTINLIQPSAIIMLGEAGDAQTIRLETTAWNEKTFRIPDIAGRIPSGIPIDPSAPDTLSSSLPLKAIHKNLQKLKIPASLSNDPGRYLCNQIFFTAINFLQSKHINIPTGFIHLPLETTLPTPIATKAISHIIQTLTMEK